MDGNPVNTETFFHCFIGNYLTSRKAEIKRGGARWLFHRDVPYYESKGDVHMGYWTDENIHTTYWWKKKLESHSDLIEFRISSFWSYIPLSSFKSIGNKILIVGRKL